MSTEQQAGESDAGWSDGVWTLKVPGGAALMANTVTALTLAIEDTHLGSGRRNVLERLRRACIEASPE
jgi:hypothetical protein